MTSSTSAESNLITNSDGLGGGVDSKSNEDNHNIKKDEKLTDAIELQEKPEDILRRMLADKDNVYSDEYDESISPTPNRDYQSTNNENVGESEKKDTMDELNNSRSVHDVVGADIDNFQDNDSKNGNNSNNVHNDDNLVKKVMSDEINNNENTIMSNSKSVHIDDVPKDGVTNGIPIQSNRESDVCEGKLPNSSDANRSENDGNNNTEVVDVMAPMDSSSGTPRLSPENFLDLTGIQSLDKEDNVGPIYQNTMPGELLKVVYHSPDSLVYMALAMLPIHNLESEMKKSVVADLSRYIQICTERGLIQEAIYVQKIKERVKKIPSVRSNRAEMALVTESLRYAESEVASEELFWANQREMADREYEISIQDLEIRKQQALDFLDRDWASGTKKRLYRKPSSKLLNMRYVTKQMMQSKQFDGAQYIGKKMIEQEQTEARAATARMEEAYRRQDYNVQRKFELERQTIEAAYRKKVMLIEHQKERSMKPINRRLTKLQNKKEKLLTPKPVKSARRSSNDFEPMPQIDQNDNYPFLQLNEGQYVAPKLNLPNIKLIQRNPPKTSRDSGKGTSKRRVDSRSGRSLSRLGNRTLE